MNSYFQFCVQTLRLSQKDNVQPGSQRGWRRATKMTKQFEYM